jgi:hypothetical protein
MGHSTPSQTLKYAKVVGARMHEVASKLASLPGREQSGTPAVTQDPHKHPQSEQ